MLATKGTAPWRFGISGVNPETHPPRKLTDCNYGLPSTNIIADLRMQCLVIWRYLAFQPSAKPLHQPFRSQEGPRKLVGLQGGRGARLI